MKKISEEITYVIQRRFDLIEGAWVDSSANYYGWQDGLKAIKQGYQASKAIFGDDVRLTRRAHVVSEEVVEDWEIALG